MPLRKKSNKQTNKNQCNVASKCGQTITSTEKQNTTT
jgi:hypothetical protein